MEGVVKSEVDLQGAAQSALDKLKAAISGPQSPKDGDVFLGSLKKTEPESGWSRLNARDDLRIQMVSGVKSRLMDFLERDLVPLEYDAVTEASIGFLPSDFEGGPANFADSLPVGEIDQTITPKSDNTPDFKIRATRMVDQDNDCSIFVFTKNGNIKSIRAANIAFFEKDLLVPADRDVFTLSDDVDFFMYGGFFFVSNPNAFQSTTNFNKAIQDKAQEGLKTLREIDTIEITNIEDFASAVEGSKIFARKLAALQYGNYLQKCSGQRIKS